MSAVAEPTSWSALRFVVASSWRNGPMAFVLSLLETVGRVLEALMPLFVGLIVTGAVERNAALLIGGVAGLLGAQGVVFLVTVLGVHKRLELNEAVGLEFDQRSGRLSGDMATMDHLVDADHRDRMQLLTERRGAMGSAFQALVNTANNMAAPIVSFIVAFAVDPRLLLLLIIALPAAGAAGLTARWDEGAETTSAAHGRLSEHLLEALTTATPASELRVMGARERIAARADETVRAWRRPQRVATGRAAALNSAVSVVYLLAGGVVLWWMVDDAIAGQVAVGAVAAAVLVVNDLRDSSESMVWTTSMCARMLRIGRRAVWLERYAEENASRHSGTIAPPKRLTTGISLRDVTFTYPGAATPTFERLSLDLPAGTTVAVVGENGAGKSTLVNLLTGMYDLDSGVIDIDGTRLPDLDLMAWREACSGAFQDHARFELTAREAIGLGDVAGESDDAAVHGALERAAASDVLTALPEGLDTQLGTEWGGVGLSGGQWQRLAIARGMVRRRPLLQVLDEPTSALDPATEHALFDGYADAARRTRDNGGITLLITHRFSTVAAADLVVVMADGGVAEVGSHAELMTAGGRYAELYNLQAAGYR